MNTPYEPRRTPPVPPSPARARSRRAPAPQARPAQAHANQARAYQARATQTRPTRERQEALARLRARQAWRTGASACGGPVQLWKRSLSFRVSVGIAATAWLGSMLSTPTPPPAGVDTAPISAEAPAVIEPSAPVEMYIPSLQLVAGFEDGACRVKDGAIDPATMDKACYYTAADRPYSLPGSATTDLTVLAGHTGAGVPAVFNDLYDGTKDEHRVAVGDKLYLRTVNSGDTWLVYTATDLHDPSKDALGSDAGVWGTGAMPGRLLTISCIQPANLLADSVRNAVVGWQYEGVATAATAAEGQAEGQAEGA